MVQVKSSEGKKRRPGCVITALIFIAVYAAFSAFLGYCFGNAFSTPATVLENHGVYQLSLTGTLEEQGREEDPFLALLSELPGMETSENVVGLDDILSNIRLAKSDDHIDGIYLKYGDLSMGPAGAKAIRDALLDFKQSGKWIIAYSSSYDLLNYYVASVADKLCLNPSGSISWNGLSAQKLYFTRLYDKLGIRMQILKVGTFKSAVEPYFRTSMSEADSTQTQLYLNGIWDEIASAVSVSRDLPLDSLNAFADRFMGLQPADTYLSTHLADTLIYSQSVDAILRTYTGTKDYTCYTTTEMHSVERTPTSATDQIAVLYLEGEIVGGTGDGIAEKSVLKQLRKIGKDSDTKALVLRVNSPGGSADASEQIWHAIQLIKDKNIPVVVSMGDYAASGGYYISCHADYIFAEPTTLTGSIGIFGVVPDWSKLRDNIGIDVDDVTTHRHSNLEYNLVLKGMNNEEEAIMQSLICRGYDLFTQRCADGRDTTQSYIKHIGEGRVYLGKDALELGLVDAIGNIDDAIAKAAQLASLDTYALAYFPERKDSFDELLKSLDPSTPEEKLIRQIRDFASEPRIMMRMEPVIIK